MEDRKFLASIIRLDNLPPALHEECKRRLEIHADKGIKYSQCCDAILIPYISNREKVCSECKAVEPWHLDKGQKPLFNRGPD